MAGTISAALDFDPTPAMLAAAIAELEALGERSGGAVDAAVRQAALRVYRDAARERTILPPQWRHDYAALAFDGLRWSSGRLRAPAPSGQRGGGAAAEGDVPALAVANAGGLVHIGSTYLEPPQTAREGRVRLTSLADARRRWPERVAAVHQQIVAPQTDRFTALATAFQNCGAYVEIPDGVMLDAPLQIVWMSRPGAPGAVFPHTVVRVGAGARVTIVERHLAAGESLVAGTVEADLGPGSRLDYVVVQQLDESSRIFQRRAARCGPDASAAWHAAELGGALVRSVYGVRLAGARAAAETNALFFASGFAHVDLASEVDHGMSRTGSRTTVRSAATDRARGRIGGAVRFAPTVRRCDAAVRIDGLILARDAYLDAAPTVAIPTNELAASQTVSIGSLDEEKLFYVQSRGISRTVAQQMMALAFFEAALAGFPSDALRDEVRTALEQRLEDVPDTFET